MNAQKWSLEKEGGSGGWRWSISLTVYIIGQLVQTFAYVFGSQELVVAVANLGIVTNALIAAVVFDEPFSTCPRQRFSCSKNILRGWDLGAVLIVVSGTVIIAIFAPPQPQSSYTADQLVEAVGDPEFMIFLGNASLMYLTEASLHSAVLVW
jgi:hypothetical protein